MPTSKLVFLDESGVICGMNRIYGWSKSGRPPLIRRAIRGKRLSIIGAMALDGVRAQMTFTGTLNEGRMLEYVEEHLGPALNPGDVVVMDGLVVHKMASVREAIARFGGTVLILPPYSPEFNPIEHLWSTLKAHLRRLGTPSWSTLGTMVQEVWEQLGSHCSNWIRHCGYAAST